MTALRSLTDGVWDLADVLTLPGGVKLPSRTTILKDRDGGLLVYGPLKLVYATGGLVVGAFAWVFTAGDTQVAEKVFTRSLRGTYVITPEILLGEQRLEFIGRDLGDRAVRTENVASASAATRPVEDPEYDELGW